ncbi:hypothetical protein MRX96_003795 [Rhipicephalus microplus]
MREALPGARQHGPSGGPFLFGPTRECRAAPRRWRTTRRSFGRRRGLERPGRTLGQRPRRARRAGGLSLSPRAAPPRSGLGPITGVSAVPLAPMARLMDAGPAGRDGRRTRLGPEAAEGRALFPPLLPRREGLHAPHALLPQLLHGPDAREPGLARPPNNTGPDSDASSAKT